MMNRYSNRDSRAAADQNEYRSARGAAAWRSHPSGGVLVPRGLGHRLGRSRGADTESRRPCLRHFRYMRPHSPSHCHTLPCLLLLHPLCSLTFFALQPQTGTCRIRMCTATPTLPSCCRWTATTKVLR